MPSNSFSARSLRSGVALGLSALSVAALTCFASPSAHAQIILNSSYNNNAGGSGYQTTSSQPYIVNSPASFNNNNIGLYDTTAPLTVNGGMFEQNTDIGLLAIAPDPVVVYGGLFDNNLTTPQGGGDGLDVYDGTLTVYGGDFSNDAANGIEIHDPTNIYGGSFNNDMFGLAVNSTVNVYGGSFSSGLNQYDFSAGTGGIVNLYGKFSSYGPLTGTGTFSGTLADGGGQQTFNYENFGNGQVILNAAPAVPEPSSFALLGLGLPMLMVRRRARQ